MTLREATKLIGNGIFTFLMLHFLGKHEGVKYESRRKGFRTGLLLMFGIMARGAIMLGLPFFKE